MIVKINQRGAWSSKLAFVFAAAGSAVGLGNLWRFSYVAGNNGGGLFVFIYLLAVLFIALPVLLAELSMGRFSNRDTVGAFEAIKSKTAFKGVGYLGFTSAIMILAFYSVIAGQTLGYIYKSFSGELNQLAKTEITVKPKEQLTQIYYNFRNNPNSDFENTKSELGDFFSEYKINQNGDTEKSQLLAGSIDLLQKLKIDKQYNFKGDLKGITKQHPFVSGNRRTALVGAFYLSIINKKKMVVIWVFTIKFFMRHGKNVMHWN